MTARAPLVLACSALALASPAASADVVVDGTAAEYTLYAAGAMSATIAVEGGALKVRGIDGQRVSPQVQCEEGTESQSYAPGRPPRCDSEATSCRSEAPDAVVCPDVKGALVRGSGSADLVRITTPFPRLHVHTDGGDDRVETGTIRDVSFIPGPGNDTLDLSGFSEGIQIRDRTFETIIGSPHNDVLEVYGQGAFDAPAVRTVFGGGGQDIVLARDGALTHVDCGGHEADRIVADDDDVVAGCALIERVTPRPAVGPLSRGVIAPHVDGRWRAIGLAASPQLLGDALRLELATVQGATATATVSVGPWRGPPELVPLPPVVAGPGDGKVPLGVTVPLPPDVVRALSTDARVRANVRLLLRHPLGDTEVREGRFTVVRLPPWRGSQTGRRLIGTFGVQRLVGSPLGDLLSGESADDLLLGMAGSDRLVGGTGNDRLHGGDGDDLMDGLDGDDRHQGGPGNDHLVETRFGDDRLDGGAGDDVLIGLRGHDELYGGPGDDILDGGSGPDLMDCGPGEDVAFLNNDRDRSLARNCEELHDGAGVLARSCQDGGTPGPETVLGTEGDDVCSAGDGADDVEGRGGHDTLLGQGGDDRIFGRFGADNLQGGDGNDEIEGGRDADGLDGGNGNDLLNGGLDADVVRGGPGDDRITARGGGADRIDCGAGRDVAIVDSSDRVRNCERISRSGAARSRSRSR